jgi:GTP-binding protein EngB required for normal cell division
MTDLDTPVGGAQVAVEDADLGLSVPRPESSGLTSRLLAVSRLIQIGSARGGAGGFDAALLSDAEELLARAGERLRLSADHTIAVLAGGTGSGKSSLFNALAGADFSPVGAVRPATREPYACVWGMRGAAPLLDWLGVQARHRYARSSALDEGERSLAGLLLLDLPDHDSVLAGQSREVNRLVSHADLMVWVLDPQKYADAAVHSRYLIPMAGHSSVMAVVLNQTDRLTPEQAADCETDLRRLLDTEGLHDARIVLTSVATGAGMDELRKVLVEAVLARRSAVERIGADVDAIAARFAPYAQAADTTGDDAVAAELPGSATVTLTDAFSQAAGVSGIGRALQSARELKAVDYVGWPVSWLADRLFRRDPVRKIRLGTLWDELRQISAGSAGAQQPEIDNAITAVGDEAGRGLPSPWPATVRRAARSAATDIPAAIGAAISEALPAENSAELWWRAMAAWQGLLLGGIVAGLAWVGALLAFGVFHASRHVSMLFRDTTLLPWVLLIVVALLAIGSLTANGCMTLVARSADRERERAEQQMRDGISKVAKELVIAPTEQELSEYARFRAGLAAARSAG